MSQNNDIEQLKNNFVEYQGLSKQGKEKNYQEMIEKFLTGFFSDKEEFLLAMIWQEEISNNIKNYPDLTKNIFKIDTNKIDEEYYNANIEKVMSRANSLGFISDENEKKYRSSLSNHIKLAIIQKDYIYSNMHEVQEKLSETQRILDNTEASLQNGQEKIENLEKTKNNIYTEFVTILGIFATIIFAIFGGFQEIQALGSNLKQVDITRILFFLPLLMLGINFIIFLSFNSISKIIGKTIKSCGHEKSCDCSFEKKHPTIFYSSKILIWFFLIGSALMLFNSKFNWSFKNVSSKINFAILIAIIVVPIIFTIYKYNKLKKSKNVEKKSNGCKEFKNSPPKSKFMNFSNYYLGITTFLILLSFIVLFIWSLRQMNGEHDLGLEKLLNHKVFLKLSIFSTLITFFLGSVLPAIYGLWTNPNDPKNKYAPKNEYEINHRGNVQDTLIFTTFLVFFILLSIFIIVFSNTTLTLTIGIIDIIVLFIILIVYFVKFLNRKNN